MNLPSWPFLLILALVIGQVIIALHTGSITIKTDCIDRDREPRLFVLINLAFCAAAIFLVLVAFYPVVVHEWGDDLAGASLLASIGTISALTAAAASQPRMQKEGAAEVAVNVFAAAVGIFVAGICFIATAVLVMKVIQ